MLQASSDGLIELIAGVFDDIIQMKDMPPQYWKVTRMKVLYKTGDAQLPGNYRPVSILPILCKLFSRVAHERVRWVLACAQTPDQSGFRPGHCCDDHLFAITMLYENAAEWNMELWIAAVDFEKAFESVEHKALWEALETQGVDRMYVEVWENVRRAGWQSCGGQN